MTEKDTAVLPLKGVHLNQLLSNKSLITTMDFDGNIP